MKDGETVVIGGTKFRIEVVNENYVRAHPVDDPLWLLRVLPEVHGPHKKETES